MILRGRDVEKLLLEMVQKENWKILWYHMVTLCPSLMKSCPSWRAAHSAVNTEISSFQDATASHFSSALRGKAKLLGRKYNITVSSQRKSQNYFGNFKVYHIHIVTRN